MIDRGTVVKYRASVTIDPSQVTELNTPAIPVRAFLVSLQGNLETGGLLMLDYKIRKATGKYQYDCIFTLQTMRDFSSKQSIVNLATNQIAQTTGVQPRWAVDPPVGGGAYAGASVCAQTCEISTLGLNPWDRFTAWIHNATYGTLNCCQARALANQETATLVQAGMSPCQAAAQAAADVQATLSASCAAPNQSCFWNSAGVKGIKKSVPMFALPALGILLAVFLLAIFVNAKASH
jgi:hypothetical protein